MSYCRWSSDNWMSDVYAYEADEGYRTHVAGNRLTKEPPPAPDVFTATKEEFMDGHRRHMNAVHDTHRVKIGGPFDGQSFTDAEPEDFVRRLEAIRDAGYRVPTSALRAARENCGADTCESCERTVWEGETRATDDEGIVLCLKCYGGLLRDTDPAPPEGRANA